MDTSEKARAQQEVRRAQDRFRRARRIFALLFLLGASTASVAFYMLVELLLTHHLAHRVLFFLLAQTGLVLLPVVLLFGLELLDARREAEKAYARYRALETNDL